MEKTLFEYETWVVPSPPGGALQPARYTYEEAMEMNGLDPTPVAIVIDLRPASAEPA
jgi:hypothetical protein